jgi:hypothetical protein
VIDPQLIAAARANAQRRNAAGFTAAVGDEVRRKIDRAIARVGMDPAAPWVWASTARYELAGNGFISGQLVVPSHIVGRTGLYPFWFVTPYVWDKNYRNYTFEVFGRQIKSPEEAQQCPSEAVWRMTAKAGTLELAVWQAFAIHKSATVYGCADWRPGWEEIGYGYGGVTPGEKNDTSFADHGLRLLRNIPTDRRGRKKGDGRTWPGGEEDFLDDLWSTVERHATITGRRWPEITGKRGNAFRTMMRGCPSERTLRDWLSDAGLRPRDIEAGKVTRANYSQFVAERQP